MTSVSIDLTPEQLQEITGPVLSPLIDSLIEDAERRLVELRQIRDQLTYGVPVDPEPALPSPPQEQEPAADPEPASTPRRRAPAKRRKNQTDRARRARGDSPAPVEILGCLGNGPATTKELCERTGLTWPTVKKYCELLLAQGKIAHVGVLGSRKNPRTWHLAGEAPSSEPEAPSTNGAEPARDPAPMEPSLPSAGADKLTRMVDQARGEETYAGDEAKTRILEALRQDPLNPHQLVLSCHVSRDEVNRCLRELVAEGNIRKVLGTGDYRAVTVESAAA